MGHDETGHHVIPKTQYQESLEQRQRIEFAETCCGNCPGGSCYVDQMLGN